MIGVGVIGYGYWGPNLVRNFYEVPGCIVRCVCDRDPSRLDLVQARYPTVEVTTTWTDLVARSDIDLVVIATPVASHFELAEGALRSGKHVLVEKPLAASVEQAEKLVELAGARGLLLMVDHTFVFTPAVQKIRELVVSGELGELYYYDSVRVNLGLFQHDVNVIWDLAVHDLSILTFVTGLRPTQVSATGAAHIPGSPEDTAFMTLFFDGPMIGHVHVNWLAPVKVRRTLIGGSKKMVVYDDIEPSEKVKVYDSGVDVEVADTEDLRAVLVSYRTGDMLAPKLSAQEALRIEAEHVLACLRGEADPLVPGEVGLEVVRILQAASESIRRHGAPMTV